MTWRENFSQAHMNPITPNFLSILRGVLGAVLPFLIFRYETHIHLIAFAIFIFAALTDYWDGKIARAHNLHSFFGKIADPITDKILILASLGAFCALGFFSVWWIVPIFAREIIVTFCRIGWVLEDRVVAAEKGGKIKLVSQVLATGACFVYLISLGYPFLTPLSDGLKIAMILLIAVALVLTLWSGLRFFSQNREAFLSPHFARFVAAAGVGLIPFIPGTWGSVMGLFIFLLVRINGWLCLATFLFLMAAGFWAVSRLDLSQHKDPQFVVMDEVGGIFVTFLGIPISWPSVLVGFLLFRLFDCWKPYPVRKLEGLPRFWGILADDLGAGVYAWLLMLFFFR